MSDQAHGMIRDSDIKFECRLLLKIIQNMALPKELEKELIDPISRIVRFENKRLDKLNPDSRYKGRDWSSTDDLWPEKKGGVYYGDEAD